MKKIVHTECELCKEILDAKSKNQEKTASNRELDTKNVHSVAENFSQLKNTIKKDNDTTETNSSEEGYIGKIGYSEGEVSSSCKVNTSTDSKDIELMKTTLSDENEFQKDLNDVVKFKSDLAHQKKANEKKCFIKDKGMNRRKYAKDQHSSDYSMEKKKVKIYNQDKRHQDFIQSKDPDYSSKIRSRQKEDCNTTGKHIFCDRKSSSDKRGKSKYLGREKTFSSSASRSTERSIKSRSSVCKDKTSTFSESVGKSNFKLSKSTFLRKRGLSPHSKFTSFSVQKKLNDRKSSTIRKNYSKNSSRSSVKNPYKDQSRKKERKPFVVNLELKEEETSKNSKKESVKEQTNKGNTQASESNENLKNLSALQAGAASCHTTLSNVGIDDLPSVSKPIALPVHIKASEEQILNDMVIRQILLIPNRPYSPSDLAEPLFSSIVSPRKKTVPALLAVGNITRLPTSNPDRDFPNQQFLVDVNKSVNDMKPNSTSLLQNSYLPSTAPFYLRLMESPGLKVDNAGVQQTVLTTDIKLTGTNQTTVQSDFQSLGIYDNLKNPNINSSRSNRNIEFLYKYKKRFRERNKEILKYLAKEIQLRVDHSCESGQTSSPLQLSVDKNSIDEACSSSFKADVKSGDADLSSSGLIHKSKQTKDKKISKTVIEIKKDPVTIKILEMFKLLREKNYQPPSVGRFIIYNPPNSVQIKFPNESPLSKNRIKLPFLTPNPKNIFQLENETEKEKSVVSLSISLQKKFQTQKYNKNSHKTKLPVVMPDVGVQCDLTKVVIRDFKTKITELETEVTRLRRVNENIQTKKRKSNDLEEMQQKTQSEI